MKVYFKASNLFTIVGEGATLKETFRDIASAAEPFSVGECGKCKGKDLVPRARKVDKFWYYEMHCRNPKCRAKLSFGQGDDDALYPRRKYHEQHPKVQSGEAVIDSWMPDGGWEVWQPQPTVAEEKGKK